MPRFNFPGVRALLTALLTLCSLAPSGAGAKEEVVADFKSGPPNGVYAFATTTPKTLGELLKPGAGEPAKITGQLFLPKGGDKVPAVVFLHGSGGVYSAMLGYWPDLLNAQGIAVFALDRFAPRGVISTAEDQSAVPQPADVADAFAALRLLASHPRIDAKRIAVMGASRGGTASWRSAVERIIAAQRLPDGLRFAAHVQAYSGGCLGVQRLVVKPGVFSKAPQLWLHGEDDNYTPIGPCRDYAQRIGEAGTPVEFVSLPGARHKFDDDDARTLSLKNAQRVYESCPLELDIETMTAYDRTTGKKLSGAEYQQAAKSCGTVGGATVGGNISARDKAGQATVAFLRKVFGP